MSVCPILPNTLMYGTLSFCPPDYLSESRQCSDLDVQCMFETILGGDLRMFRLLTDSQRYRQYTNPDLQDIVLIQAMRSREPVTFFSAGWWENYVSGQWSLCGKVTFSFQRARKVVQDVKDTANFLMAPFKVGLAVLLAKSVHWLNFFLE